MKSTVVPNRNMILLALAGGHALSLGFDTIAYAAHAGDHTIYLIADLNLLMPWKKHWASRLEGS